MTNPILKNMLSPSRSNAIKAMCCHCVGCTLETLEQGYRNHIRNCTASHCPLYKFRPYQEQLKVNPCKKV
jgi:hypothetical protein